MRQRQLPLFLAAAMGGAALAYYLDPRSGRRRRHLARDKAVHYARQGGRRGRRLVRHASSDAYGMGRRFASRLPHMQPGFDDAPLVDRVESIVFRDREIPKGQININAERAIVFLRGEVARPELLEELEARVRKVRGVRGVENKLHVTEEKA
jgi:hyperosmotically inducible periplasmic protein